MHIEPLSIGSYPSFSQSLRILFESGRPQDIWLEQFFVIDIHIHTILIANRVIIYSQIPFHVGGNMHINFSSLDIVANNIISCVILQIYNNIAAKQKYHLI